MENATFSGHGNDGTSFHRPFGSAKACIRKKHIEKDVRNSGLEGMMPGEHRKAFRGRRRLGQQRRHGAMANGAATTATSCRKVPDMEKGLEVQTSAGGGAEAANATERCQRGGRKRHGDAMACNDCAIRPAGYTKTEQAHGRRRSVPRNSKSSMFIISSTLRRVVMCELYSCASVWPAVRCIVLRAMRGMR